MALSILVACIHSVSAAAQATLRVPQDRSSIQAAIDAAAHGDTVLVAPGIYLENINFNGKAITLRSERGPNVTVIDGKGAGSVVTIANGEGGSTRLIGFTLRNGLASHEGGGIDIRDASPVISENILVGNIASYGSALAVLGGSPLVHRNVVTGQMLGGFGTIYVGGLGSAQMLGNVVAGNMSSGFDLFNAGTPTISGNIISGNAASQGGALVLANTSDALIVQNLIFGNSAQEGGGIYWGVPSPGRGPYVVSNTIVENDSPRGSGIFASGYDAQTMVVNNIIVAKPGQTALHCSELFDASIPAIQFNIAHEPSGLAFGGLCTSVAGTAGNISADPLFVDSSQADYRLRSTSAAVDSGINTAAGLPLSDIDGRPRIHDGDGNGAAVVDIGAYEFTTTPRQLTVAINGNDLGTLLTGARPETRVATLSNAGPGTATVAFSTVASNDTASFVLTPGGGTPCTSLSPSLAAGTNCTLSVTFTPTTSGAKKALLVVMSDAAGSPAIAPLSANVLQSDTTPDAFSFLAQSGVTRGSTVVSNTITLHGINAPSPISISGGEYSIDGAAFTAAAGSVQSGQTVAVRLIASQSYGTTVSATLTIGGSSAIFQVTTAPHLVSAASYFPLNVGNSWVLRTNGVTNTATVTETPTINGALTLGIRDSSDGSTTYYSNDALGVRLHRVTIPGVTVPNCGSVTETDTYGPPALIVPPTATVGQTYTASGNVTADLGPCGTYQFAYSLASRVETIERVSVPAGQFDALKVRLTLSVAGVSANTTVWLAPGVGEVKGLDDSGVTDELVSTNVVRTAPDEFAFASQSNVPIGSTVESNVVSISGITAPAPVSIIGGDYSIDGGPYTSQPGSIPGGRNIRVRLISSPLPLTTRSASLTIGGVMAVFQATTGAGAPSQPTSVTAAGAPGAIVVSFSPPANNGGAEITGYSATCASSNGGASSTGTASAGATSIRVSGVSNGSTYTCTVAAMNVMGAGTISAPSNAVVPFNLLPILDIIFDD